MTHKATVPYKGVHSCGFT